MSDLPRHLVHQDSSRVYSKPILLGVQATRHGHNNEEEERASRRQPTPSGRVPDCLVLAPALEPSPRAPKVVGKAKPRGSPSARQMLKRGASQPTREASLRHLEARCAGWESRFQWAVRTRASQMRAGWVLMTPSLAWSCSCQMFERL